MNQVELVCEGKCNQHRVLPGDVGPFRLRIPGGTVRHTPHQEVASEANIQANLRKRRFKCDACGTVRTYGVEALTAEEVTED